MRFKKFCESVWPDTGFHGNTFFSGNGAPALSLFKLAWPSEKKREAFPLASEKHEEVTNFSDEHDVSSRTSKEYVPHLLLVSAVHHSRVRPGASLSLIENILVDTRLWRNTGKISVHC